MSVLNTNNNFIIKDNKIINNTENSDTNKIITNSNGNNGDVSFKLKDNDTVIIITKPNIGYEVDVIEVFDKDGNKIEVKDNEFKKPEGDVNISVKYKSTSYKFILGQNSIFDNNDLVFKLNGEFSLVDKVYVNDEELDSKNYELKEGSTIVTLKKSYLSTLKSGTYNLKVTYKNNSSDTTNFVIKNLDTNQNVSNTSVVANPKTIDNVFVFVILSLISIVGIYKVSKYN